MTDNRLDRRHNREEDSPEALRRSIEALAQTIATLDRRFDEVTQRLDGELDSARTTTRRLATEVGLMGEALVRRMDAERPWQTSAKRRRRSIWPWAFALTVGLVVATVGVFAFQR
jgi:hypothetical protein